jgi:hypothetical protein
MAFYWFAYSLTFPLDVTYQLTFGQCFRKMFGIRGGGEE